ncbi:MAG: lactate utilization protein [Firmicutes bacterium]|nr:lactate utilization protein [Bacillota bacterium]
MNRKEKVTHNLERNNVCVCFAENKKCVVPIVDKLLEKGDIVATSNSISLFKCGIIEHLKCGKYNYLTRHKPKLPFNKLQDIYFDAFKADVFLCDCDAITENGELYNVDCSSNKSAVLSYGPKRVIVVVGWNSIVKDIDEAISIVRRNAVLNKACKTRFYDGADRKGLGLSCQKGRINVIVVEENL